MAWTPASIPELPGWAKYCQEMKALGDVTFLDGAPARFYSRWRMARSFVGLNLDGYGDARTIKGNNVLFRLLLAYSTLDQLREVEESLVDGLKVIRDKPTADLLRATLNIDALVGNEKVSRMKSRGAFIGMESTADVMVFGRALRHIGLIRIEGVVGV